MIGNRVALVLFALLFLSSCVPSSRHYCYSSIIYYSNHYLDFLKLPEVQGLFDKTENPEVFNSIKKIHNQYYDQIDKFRKADKYGKMSQAELKRLLQETFDVIDSTSILWPRLAYLAFTGNERAKGLITLLADIKARQVLGIALKTDYITTKPYKDNFCPSRDVTDQLVHLVAVNIKESLEQIGSGQSLKAILKVDASSRIVALEAE